MEVCCGSPCTKALSQAQVVGGERSRHSFQVGVDCFKQLTLSKELCRVPVVVGESSEEAVGLSCAHYPIRAALTQLKAYFKG